MRHKCVMCPFFLFSFSSSVLLLVQQMRLHRNWNKFELTKDYRWRYVDSDKAMFLSPFSVGESPVSEQLEVDRVLQGEGCFLHSLLATRRFSHTGARTAQTLHPLRSGGGGYSAEARCVSSTGKFLALFPSCFCHIFIGTGNLDHFVGNGVFSHLVKRTNKGAYQHRSRQEKGAIFYFFLPRWWKVLKTA